MNKGKDFSAGCKFSTVTCKRSQKKCLTQQWIRLPIRRNCLFDWKPAGRCWIWALRDEPVWRDQQVTPAKLHLTKLLRSVSVDVIGAGKPNLLCIASPHLNHWLCSVLILVWPWLFGVSQQVVITSLLSGARNFLLNNREVMTRNVVHLSVGRLVHAGRSVSVLARRATAVWIKVTSFFDRKLPRHQTQIFWVCSEEADRVCGLLNVWGSSLTW